MLPDKLQKVTVPVVGDATCDDLYNRDEITDSMICAGDIEQGIYNADFVIFIRLMNYQSIYKKKVLSIKFHF